MSITPKGQSIQECYRLFRDGKIIVNRKYQRKLVWSNEQKERLIDSIMAGYPIPLILLAERADKYGSGVYEILDGVQRLTAIFDFIENRVSWGNKYFNINEHIKAKNSLNEGCYTITDIPNKQYITSDECADFLDYQLAVTIYPAMAETDMIEVFGRINSQGKQLSNQERRQAGVVNKFSDLVRKIAFELRGDVSKDILKLYEMPAISFDDNRNDMSYGLKADNIFWCKQGILWKNELKSGEDEEMIADILASIILDTPFPRSREAFDSLYDENSPIYNEINTAMLRTDVVELYENVIGVFSTIKDIIESCSDETNYFRDLVSNQKRNPAKTVYYTFFMAMYDLMIKKKMSPVSPNKIMKSIEKLQSKLATASHFVKEEDRVQNINLTIGLIQNCFVKQDPPLLGHGGSLIVDFENSVRRSKAETSRYEFKQGIYSVEQRPKLNEELIDKILHTIVAIANSTFNSADGFLYIGVADSKEDAEQINNIYSSGYIKLEDKYVVGIDREIDANNMTIDQYISILLDKIKHAKISEPLKTQVLTNIDVISYKKYSVIRIRIPKQNTISLFDEKVYVRTGSSTKIVDTTSEILAIQELFTKA